MPNENNSEKPYSLRGHGEAPFSEGLPPRTENKQFKFDNSFGINATIDSGIGKTLIESKLTSDEDPEEETVQKNKNTIGSVNLNITTIVNNNNDNPAIGLKEVEPQQINNLEIVDQVDREEIEQPENMALAPNQSISLNEALTFVPRFEGDSSDLIDFIYSCDEVKSVLPVAAKANLVKFIYGSELGPKVKDSLNNVIPATIEDLIKALKKIYVPSKSLFQLQGELGRIYQKEGESVVDFVNGLRKKGKEIVECFLSDNPASTPAQVTEFENKIESSIATCFTQNLRNEIDQRMPVCENVVDALDNAIKIEKKLNARRELRRNSRTTDQKKNTPSKPVKFAAGVSNKLPISNNSLQTQNKNDPVNVSQNNNNVLSNQNCNRCGQSGHFSNVFPSVKCQTCYKLWHSAKNCPELKKNEQDNRYANVKCQLCGDRGHTARYCKRNPNKSNPSNNSYSSNNNNSYNNYRNNNDNTRKKYCDFCQRGNHDQVECVYLRRATNFLQRNRDFPPPRDTGRDNRPARPVNTIQETLVEDDSE